MNFITQETTQAERSFSVFPIANRMMNSSNYWRRKIMKIATRPAPAAAGKNTKIAVWVKRLNHLRHYT
jgi:hypothetical protein